MALVYETGTPSSIEDLVDKLQTFAAANGWTVDEFNATTDRCSIHESNMYVHFAWDATSQNALAIYQALGYNGGSAINAQPNDSGNGDPTPTTIDAERRVTFGAVGPYTAYHFFASDSAPMYIHIVVEVSAGVFRHFGFGTIEKINDWTGGEYAYGHIWNTSAATIDAPSSSSHSLGLDASVAGNTDGATMHMEGVGAQGVNEKWGCFSASSGGTDTAGETRRLLLGTARDGLYVRYMAHIRNNGLNAYVPIIPICVLYRDLTTTPDTLIWLGQQPNVGVINISSFSPGDEITLGGETWMIFPWVRKQFLQNDTQESWNAGFAYRKS